MIPAIGTAGTRYRVMSRVWTPATDMIEAAHIAITTPARIENPGRLRRTAVTIQNMMAITKAPRVLDTRRRRDRDVGGFDHVRRRCPHPRHHAISCSRSADGRNHAVPFRRRTGRNDRIPASSRFPTGPFLNFIFAFCGSGVVYPYGRERSFAAFNAGERDETS